MADGLKDDGASGRNGPEVPPRGSALSGRRSLRSPKEALQPEAAPPPPPARKRSPIIATASGVLSFIGIAAIVAIALISFGLQKFNAPGPLAADKTVYIEGGGRSDIVAQLESEGVIDNALMMTAALYLHAGQQKLKAGEYEFKRAVSLNDVIETLISGKQVMHSITIPEGLTSEQIVQRLNDEPLLAGTVRSVPKDGTLMPDTYKFARGTKRDQIITNMQQEQKKVAAEVWAHRAPETLLKSPYEMTTLASIVEKETGKSDERARVAGVFTNRLSRNIPLQSDPTIVYGLVGGKGTLGRGILKSEIEQKTPYNTYTIVGLPPGPICNPGRAALEAAVDPAKTKDIFFVADGTGGHVFAETLDQHKVNVQHYRQIEKDAKDKLPPDSDKLLQITPLGTPAAKPNQRGDAAPVVPVYGVLKTDSFASLAAVPQVRTLDPADLPLSVSLAGDGSVVSAVQPMLAAQTPGDPQADGDLGGLSGIDTAPDAGSAEERALVATGGGTMMTFPVPAARRADERAQAAQFGLAAGSDKLPPQAELVSTDPAASSVRGPSSPGKGRALDASEGTKLDPLLNKSYDLMSAKTVPAFLDGSKPSRPAPSASR